MFVISLSCLRYLFKSVIIKLYKEFSLFFLQKLFPDLTFDLLPGDLLRSLIKLGFCDSPIAERVCYDFMELVIGMDSKNIDEVNRKMVQANFLLDIVRCYECFSWGGGGGAG